MYNIIFPHGGGVAVICPSAECGLTLAQIARKDVPQGVPFLVVDAREVPSDRTFRAAWETDFSSPTGYGDPDGYWAEEGRARLATIEETGE